MALAAVQLRMVLLADQPRLVRAAAAAAAAKIALVHFFPAVLGVLPAPLLGLLVELLAAPLPELTGNPALPCAPAPVVAAAQEMELLLKLVMAGPGVRREAAVVVVVRASAQPQTVATVVTALAVKSG